jgi:hypothetical protein
MKAFPANYLYTVTNEEKKVPSAVERMKSEEK